MSEEYSIEEELEEVMKENKQLREALNTYEEGRYQEHLKIQMAIDYIKNVMAHNSSNDIASRKRLLEILGDEE